jgi:hypothetical protein
MGFSIKVTTEQFSGNEDRSWLGARLDEMWMPRSITLKANLFLTNHLAAKGAIPSGTALAKVTATGLYGPYDPAAVDGRNACAGLLFNTTRLGDPYGQPVDLTTAGDSGAPLFWAGVVKASKLPVFVGTTIGTLDAGAKTALGNFVRFE